jgi:O-antigen ligase
MSDNLLPGMEWAKTFKNIYILFLAMIFILKRDVFQPKLDIIKKFIPFFIIAAICLLWAGTLIIGIQKTFSYFLIFLIVPNYVSFLYKSHGSGFFRELTWFFGLILTVSVLTKFVWPEIGIMEADGRFRGIFGNPNGIGLFTTISFVFWNIAKNYYPNEFNRWQLVFLYLLYFYCAFLTGSRSALISLFMFLALYRLFKIHAFIGFLLFSLVVIFFNDISNAMIDLLINLGYGETFRLENIEEGSGRLIAWNFAWEHINEYTFFLGGGISYDEFYFRGHYDMLERLGHQGGVHNSYLILWLNTGLIGLILYFKGFFQLWFKASRLSNMAFPAMLTFMFTIMFEAWMTASLNPHTTIYLCSLSILAYPFFQEDAEKEEETDLAPADH